MFSKSSYLSILIKDSDLFKDTGLNATGRSDYARITMYGMCHIAKIQFLGESYSKTHEDFESLCQNIDVAMSYGDLLFDDDHDDGIQDPHEIIQA